MAHEAAPGDLAEIVRSVHQALLAGDRTAPSLDSRAVRRLVLQQAPLLSASEIESAVAGVARLLHGLGPLEPLLADPQVDEVMINGPGKVWVERNGAIEPTTLRVDAELLQIVIERILTPLGLRADRLSPFVDARLPDGSRVNVAVPPLAIDGPYVTIRRFRAQAFELSDFCNGAIESALLDALRARRSIVVSGGTGSGKTSLLNALCRHIDPGERVVTIEDTAELRLPREHIVRLESRPANAEGIGSVPIRALVRNALRMRPDRLIVGEVRGGEAFDMIQAMNTGHQGSMSTCHANSPVDALRRLETMALMADVDLPLAVVRESLMAAVDLVVHVSRASDGRRRVQALHECSGEPVVDSSAPPAPAVRPSVPSSVSVSMRRPT